MRFEQLHRAPVDPVDGAAEALAVLGGEVRGQKRNVFRALAQRRQSQREDVQSVIEVAAEPSGAHVFHQVAIGGGDDPDVNVNRIAAAEPLEFALLQYAQQHHLQLRRQLSDLVQKERAAVGLLESSFAARHGAGESAALVTEQFRSQQGVRNSGAVEFDQRPARARR